MDERITAVVTIESPLTGSLFIEVRPTDVHIGLGIVRTALILTIWRADASGVRMSLRNPVSGSMAYLQSGTALIGFARELGFDVGS